MKLCNPSCSPCNSQRRSIFLDCLLVHMACQFTCHSWLSRTYTMLDFSDVGVPKTPKDHKLCAIQEGNAVLGKTAHCAPILENHGGSGSSYEPKALCEGFKMLHFRHLLAYIFKYFLIPDQCQAEFPTALSYPSQHIYENRLGSMMEMSPFPTTFRSNT